MTPLASLRFVQKLSRDLKRPAGPSNSGSPGPSRSRWTRRPSSASSGFGRLLLWSTARDGCERNGDTLSSSLIFVVKRLVYCLILYSATDAAPAARDRCRDGHSPLEVVPCRGVSLGSELSLAVRLSSTREVWCGPAMQCYLPSRYVRPGLIVRKSRVDRSRG